MPAVTTAVARRFRDLQASFFQSVGVDFRARTIDGLRAYLGQAHIVPAWDSNGVCVLKVDTGRNEVRVELLLPRGTDCALLFPALLAAFKEAYRRYPVGDMRAWATFIAAVDEDGLPDGGRGECLAWQPYFPGSVVEEHGGGWMISATLGECINGRPP